MFRTWYDYGKSKDLAERTQSDKVLWDKPFKISKNSNFDGCQRGLASMVCKFFYNKSSRSSVAAKSVPNY